ncbi:MAG: PilN domain-containing protein [Acidobacteriia bacterium]|nr:PilN domain-containing protein [Terriglobia bacterium]
MIRTNLSTRPFYNEQAVHVLLGVVALAVVAATAFNVSRVLRYSRSDTRLATEASQDESKAAALRKQAASVRASIDPKLLDVASAEARQANDLIDRRTFSWTELFNRLETTLPDDAHIASVQPKIDKNGTIVLTIKVTARSVDDVSTFMERLEKTGAFARLYSVEDRFDDQGLLQSVLEGSYVPGSARAAGTTQ